MKAVAYNINPFEKEFLAKANQKKHDITLIANPLSHDTVNYAAGKDAVIVYMNDDIGAPVIEKLADLGVKYMVTCSAKANTVVNKVASAHGIKMSNIPVDPLQEQTHDAFQEIADQTIESLDLWQQNKCIGKACVCAKDCKTISSQKTKL